MKILQVHKYLYRRAGAEAYVLDLAELLIKNGHQVALWGTNAQPILHNSYFIIHNSLLVEHLNFNKRENVWRDIRKVGHMLWSFEAAKKFDAVLKEFKPDIIHIHNIYHHISPSILSVARKYKVPVVMSVHDYKLINPNYTLFDHGAICERQGWRVVAHRCIQNSYVASLAGVLEWQIHKWLKVYEKNVARYIAPTEFVKKKLVESGVEEKKIEVVPLMVDGEKGRKGGEKKEGFILFAGRLTEEKGVNLLLDVAEQLSEIQFKIVGDGPEFKNLKIKKFKNVELLGFVEKEKLQKFIAGARLVVVPSLWYDPSPLAVLEAMAQGKVVVGSRIGGIPELIKDGETGFLINCTTLSDVQAAAQHSVLVGDVQAAAQHSVLWVDAIKKLYYDETLLKRVGQAAGEYIKREHNPEKHYERIMEIYERTIVEEPIFNDQ